MIEVGWKHLGEVELGRYRALEAMLPDPSLADPNPARAKSIPADQQSFLAAYESREQEMIDFLIARHLVTLPPYLGTFQIRQLPEALQDEAAEILKAHPNVTVNVNGYCDAIGSVRYNLKLSERRADAVVRYLADHGVAESRMTPHGYGKTNFVATNKTAEGRAQNRRVELVPNQ